MTMDFSHLHMYIPPHCAPENTGYTYSLSSSYSTDALEFEKEHKIGPVFDSPKLSRQSLKLHFIGGWDGNKGHIESSQNHSPSYSRSTNSKKWSVRNIKHQKVQSGNQMLQSSTALSHNCIGWSKSSELNCSSGNGAVSITDTHSTLDNGYFCKNSIHAESTEALTVKSVSSTTLSSSASHSGGFMADPSFCSTVCILDKNLWNRKAYSYYCSSMNIKHVMAADGLLILIHSIWKAVSGAFWGLGTGWYQLVTLMSLINIFILTRCLPKLLKLLLSLLPFLLLFGLWYLSPPSAMYYLPTVNLTEWRMRKFAVPPAVSLSFLPFVSLLSPKPFFNTEPSSPTEPIMPTATSQVAEVLNLERVDRLEQLVATLWESVRQKEQQADQYHDEALGHVYALQEQLNTQTDKDSLGLWILQLLESKFDTLSVEIEREVSTSVQLQKENMKKQKAHSDRLAQLEMLLQALAHKTEEVHQKQKDAPAPSPVKISQEDNEALLREVQRLEAELERIKQSLKGVTGCQWKCGQLDTLHTTVSSRVREELYTLFYGDEMVQNRDIKLADSLLPWLSSQYTNSSDLLATLAILERSIVENVSLRLKQSKTQPCDKIVYKTVLHTTRSAGIMEEQVHLIVQNALKLYSQDRTGLVDYALESAGGSILSTRCSETYETKTALMSLFGIPLWYFSQSPRAVIQPDVYPGNCWAFKGSHGYLVIRLSLSVVPMAFCLEHIPKALSPTGNISSAPRHFRVYGLEDEYQEEGKLLGDYEYRENGESLQMFPVVNNEKAFQTIEMRVLSNWGHPEYTCLYRFRVHGHPHTK